MVPEKPFDKCCCWWNACNTVIIEVGTFIIVFVNLHNQRRPSRNHPTLHAWEGFPFPLATCQQVSTCIHKYIKKLLQMKMYDDVRSLPGPSHSKVPPHTQQALLFLEVLPVLALAGKKQSRHCVGPGEQRRLSLLMYISWYMYIYICFFKQYIYMICVCVRQTMIHAQRCFVFWNLDCSFGFPGTIQINPILSPCFRSQFLQSLHATDLSNFQPQCHVHTHISSLH